VDGKIHVQIDGGMGGEGWVKGCCMNTIGSNLS